MKKISAILVLLAMLALGATVCAQDENAEGSEKDFLEVALFGGLSMPAGGISDWTTQDAAETISAGAKAGLSLGFDLGYFVTPNFVAGVNYTYNQFGIDTDESAFDSRHHRMFGVSAYGKYYFFGTSRFVPYVKAQAGVDFPKFATAVVEDGDVYVVREFSYHPGFAFGVGGGLLYYTFDFGGLYLEANYRNGLTKDVVGKLGDDRYTFGKNSSVLDIHAGIKVFFGKE